MGFFGVLVSFCFFVLFVSGFFSCFTSVLRVFDIVIQSKEMRTTFPGISIKKKNHKKCPKLSFTCCYSLNIQNEFVEFLSVEMC